MQRAAPEWPDAVDLYWLRAVQYYGRQKLLDAPTGYADLRPLLETAAELDPRFEIVYRYGAVFLSEAMPVGAGQPEAGVALLKKGAEGSDVKALQEALS